MPKAIPGMIAALVLALWSPTQAQTTRANELFEAKTLRCEWDRGTTASWDEGRLDLQQARFGKDATVTFEAIDVRSGTARIVGNVGAGSVNVISTPAGLSFIEEAALGNVNFTTVFARRMPRDRRLIAVTSRHQDIGGPFPSLFHGSCKITK